MVRKRKIFDYDEPVSVECGYYIISCYFKEGNAKISEYPKLSPPLDNWMKGTKIDLDEEAVLQYEIMEDETGTMRPFYNFAIPLFEHKIVKILEDKGVDNIQFYHAIITDLSNGSKVSDYCSFNIIGLISLMDEENSEYSRLGFGDTKFIERLAILKSNANGLKVFRLREAPHAIFVHESIRGALEEGGVKGITFENPVGWSG